MLSRVISSFANLVIRRRIVVLLVVTGLAVALGLQIPNLEADFTPSDLFAHGEEQEQVTADFQEAFGNTDNIILVLVTAQDVLTTRSLQYIHDLSLALSEKEHVDRVESITVTPIPRLPSEESSEQEAPAGDSTEVHELAEQLGMPTLSPEPAQTNGLGGLGGLLPPLRLGDLESLLPRVEVDPVISGDTVELRESRELRRALADSPLLQGKLISLDGKVAAIAVVLSRDITRNEEVMATVADISSVVEHLPPPAGIGIAMAGLPYVRMVVVNQMRSDQTILVPSSLVVCLLILLFSFRWLAGVLVPTVAVALSTTMLVGGMALVGEPLNIINSIVPMLVLVIGISGSIHLVNRYREESIRDPNPQRASRRALKRMTAALFLTSGTTAIGFGSLLVSVTPMLSRFGITAAIGIMLAFLVSITFLPAGLSLMPPPKQWKDSGGKYTFLERIIADATRQFLRFRWVVLAVSAGFLAVSLYMATNLEVNSAVMDQIDEDAEIYQTTRLLERSLQGMRPLEVSLSSPREGRFDDPTVLNAIDRVKGWANRQPEVVGTNAYTDFLHEAWYRTSGEASTREAPFENPDMVAMLGRMLEQGGDRNPIAAYVTSDRRRARLNIQVADVGAQQTLVLIDELSLQLDEAFGGLDEIDVAVTGDAYLGSIGLNLVIRDLAMSLLTAVLIIFGLLTVALRSWRLGLLSIPPNIIPLVGTMAYMSVRGITLNLATVIIFSISIGMAVDGTIHVLARFREEMANGGSIDNALIRAARGTGKAIAFTCISLILGFSVMFLSSFPPVRTFGELIAFTMLSCLISTIVMVPAMLKVGFKHGFKS